MAALYDFYSVEGSTVRLYSVDGGIMRFYSVDGSNVRLYSVGDRISSTTETCVTFLCEQCGTCIIDIGRQLTELEGKHVLKLEGTVPRRCHRHSGKYPFCG